MGHICKHFRDSLYSAVPLISGLVSADNPNKTETSLLSNCFAIVKSQGPLFHLIVESDNALVSRTKLMVLKTTSSDVFMQTIASFPDEQKSVSLFLYRGRELEREGLILFVLVMIGSMLIPCSRIAFLFGLDFVTSVDAKLYLKLFI